MDPYGSHKFASHSVCFWGGSKQFVNTISALFNNGTNNSKAYYRHFGTDLSFKNVKPNKKDDGLKFNYIIHRNKQMIKFNSSVMATAQFANTVFAQRHYYVSAINDILSCLSKNGDVCFTLASFQNVLVLDWMLYLKKSFKSVQLHKLSASGYNR